MAKNEIRQIRNVPIFREPDEIFKKFQNWHIGVKKIIGRLLVAFCSKLTFACCLGRKTKFATIVYIVRKCPVKENSASNVVVGLERTTLRILSFKNLNANFYPLYDFYDFLNQSIVNLKYSLQLS